MAKFKNVGYFAKNKKDPTKRTIVITESITVPKGESKFGGKVYLQMYDIKKSDKQTEEQFAELSSWKLKDLVLITDE